MFTPKLKVAEPQLFVVDFGVAIEFYGRVLGFSTRFTYGEPPFYGQIERDSAKLNLRLVDEPPISAILRQSAELLSATITVENLEGLYEEFRTAGAEFHQELKMEEWGAKTFIVRDPEGNLILFAE